LEELKESSLIEPLYKSINPITKYKLKGAGNLLRTAGKWNIV